MNDYGYSHPVCRKIRLDAMSPTGEDIKYLLIPTQLPILRQYSTFMIEDVGVIEYFIVRARSDRFRFSMTFQE